VEASSSVTRPLFRRRGARGEDKKTERKFPPSLIFWPSKGGEGDLAEKQIGLLPALLGDDRKGKRYQHGLGEFSVDPMEAQEPTTFARAGQQFHLQLRGGKHSSCKKNNPTTTPNRRANARQVIRVGLQRDCCLSQGGVWKIPAREARGNEAVVTNRFAPQFARIQPAEVPATATHAEKSVGEGGEDQKVVWKTQWRKLTRVRRTCPTAFKGEKGIRKTPSSPLARPRFPAEVPKKFSSTYSPLLSKPVRDLFHLDGRKKMLPCPSPTFCERPPPPRLPLAETNVQAGSRIYSP